MKTFFKRLLVVIVILLSTTIVTNLASEQSAYAGCRDLLPGFTSWDCGLNDSDPALWQGDDKIIGNIWTIVANVANDLLVVASYLTLGYVIYGGYLYMFASGDSNKTASGKKTLTRAFIGLAIVLLSKVIVNSLHIALLHNNGAAFAENCTEAGQCASDSDALFGNLIQWVIGISGIVAAVFIVIGAVGYLTSAGDPNKLKKAKDTIMYALIGLAIVGLAEIITIFISSTINNANSYINTTTIAKEIK